MGKGYRQGRLGEEIRKIISELLLSWEIGRVKKLPTRKRKMSWRPLKVPKD